MNSAPIESGGTRGHDSPNVGPRSHADPPDELISGTVTFLFADIEGSTRLV